MSCPYCDGGESLRSFAYPLSDLDTCKVYVFKEQSKPGRCVCAYTRHVGEIADLSDEERNAFLADVTKVARAIHAAYHPDKLNYGAYGDTGGHLHIHLCPKYKDGDEWGGTFTMNSGKVLLSDDRYEAIAEKIRTCL